MRATAPTAALEVAPVVYRKDAGFVIRRRGFDPRRGHFPAHAGTGWYRENRWRIRISAWMPIALLGRFGRVKGASDRGGVVRCQD